MPKMHYFSNKFSKIAKRWPLNLQYWWPEVAWFGQIAAFQTWLWRNELKNSVV